MVGTRASTTRQTTSLAELEALTIREIKSRISNERKLALARLRKQATREGRKTPKKLPPAWTNDALIQYEAALDARRTRKRKASVDSLEDGEDAPIPRETNDSEESSSEYREPGSKRSSRDPVAGDGHDEEMPELQAVTDSSDNEDDDYPRRPGPLNGSQRRDCAGMADTLRTWVQEKAREWGVGSSSVAHALGLHNTERRRNNLWNKHQRRFYAMDLRRPNGTSNNTM